MPGRGQAVCPVRIGIRSAVAQYLTAWRSRKFSASLPCSMARVDKIPASVQVAAATVTDSGESVLGQPVSGFRMCP